MKFSKPAIAGAMGLAIILILLTVGLINLATPDEPTAAVPVTVPGPTVTVTATPSPAPTETVEVEVPVTPKACEEFIEDADKLVQLEAEVIDLAGQALAAVSEFDAEAIERINKKMDNITPKIEKARDAYSSSRAGCASA